MCGIAGICSLSGHDIISEMAIRKMIGAINHRGPDGVGVYLDDRVGLGHARLSIIDLEGGGQPIHNEDETLWIIYNGEIFNYPELQQELIQRGHRFYTGTDTEVILHLYEEQGPRCLETLNGQFAFAIWDARKQELFLARDRFGILPLHFAVISGRLLFASEIKSLFSVDEMPRSMDPISMDQIFTFWTTLAGRTVFKDICEIPAGHCMTVTRGSMTLRRYWDIPFVSPGGYFDDSSEDLGGRLGALIHDAVRIRLRADVPVGCYVSGGLDSSCITALVKEHFDNDLRTFGIRFEERAFDESEHQQYLVDHLGTVHTAVLARNKDIGARLGEALWYCEKPLLRTAPVPLFLLSQEVRNNGFKVVLTGEGADEVFGGYDIFREAKILKFWARSPQSYSRPRLLGRIYPYIFQDNPRGLHFVRSFFGAGLNSVDAPLFSHLLRWDTTKRIKTFFAEEFRDRLGDYSCYEDLRQRLPSAYAEWDYLSKAQYLEIAIFMTNYLLSSQGDRMAMAHSVEMRPPFLDHRIVDFMGRVRPQQRIKGLNEKYLLKKSFKDLVPERILNRQKHPYRAPIRSSILRGDHSLWEHYLSDRALDMAGMFDSAKVKRLLSKLQASQYDNEVDNMALAGILTSQIIYDRFIAGFPVMHIKPALNGLLFDRRSRTAR